ncbi:MAG: hypothetical protein AB8F34_03815 [Akkermansiaceae bacterium]
MSDLHEPFLLFTSPLQSRGIRYMVSGSVAAIFYGEPRLTNDVDIVLWITSAEVDSLIDAFPETNFYCPPKEVILGEMARPERGHGNLIHHETGFKADLYFVAGDPLHIWGLSNTRDGEIDGETFRLAPPEYVIVRKLEFYREGNSPKHLRDIHRILATMENNLDTELLNTFIRERHLDKEWQQARHLDD